MVSASRRSSDVKVSPISSTEMEKAILLLLMLFTLSFDVRSALVAGIPAVSAKSNRYASTISQY